MISLVKETILSIPEAKETALSVGHLKIAFDRTAARQLREQEARLRGRFDMSN